MAKMRLKTGDTVVVITGKDKGKEGKILDVDIKKNRVLVEGVNKATKHTKPSAQNSNGGIIHQEAFIHASNVMLVNGGKRTRIGITEEKVTRKDGKVKTVRKRVARATGNVIDK